MVNKLVNLLPTKIAIFPFFLKILSFSGLLPRNQGFSCRFFHISIPGHQFFNGPYTLVPIRKKKIFF